MITLELFVVLVMCQIATKFSRSTFLQTHPKRTQRYLHLYKGHRRPPQQFSFFIVPNEEADSDPQNALNIHAGDEDQVMEDLSAARAGEDL